MARDISRGIDPSMQYLSSAFNSNSTDSTLSRMLGNEVKAKNQFCAECGNSIEIGYKNPDNINSTAVYCKKHYEELFASKCEGCNQPIMGQFLNVNGKKYHLQCHSQDIACSGCNQRIFGETIQACDKNWHPKCFKCTLCYAPLNSTFMERKGFPYCQKCANEPSKVSSLSINQQRQDKNKEIEKKNQINKEIASNIQKGKLFCAGCGQIININDAVNHGDSTFHIHCFTCAKCNKPLAEVGFKEINGEPLCPSCAGVGISFCAGCGQKLIGQYINAMGQKWHKNCFVCSSCSKPFDSGYAEKDGKPYCATCISSQQKKMVSSTVITTGEKK